VFERSGLRSTLAPRSESEPCCVAGEKMGTQQSVKSSSTDALRRVVDGGGGGGGGRDFFELLLFLVDRPGNDDGRCCSGDAADSYLLTGPAAAETRLVAAPALRSRVPMAAILAVMD